MAVPDHPLRAARAGRLTRICAIWQLPQATAANLNIMQPETQHIRDARTEPEQDVYTHAVSCSFGISRLRVRTRVERVLVYIITRDRSSIYSAANTKHSRSRYMRC